MLSGNLTSLTLRNKGWSIRESRIPARWQSLPHIRGAFDLVDKRLCADLSHPKKWLPDRRQPGIGERGAGNIIETHHGDILRHTQTCFTECPDRSDRKNIVISKERSDLIRYFADGAPADRGI